jgi:thioredoxin 1
LRAKNWSKLTVGSGTPTIPLGFGLFSFALEFSTMGALLEVSDASFPSEVLNSTIPVMVDFWAPWCGPCRAIAPMVEELATENAGSMKIVKMNVDDNSQFPMQFQIESIPTLIIFKGGQPVERITGARPKAMMQQIIDANKA